MVNFLTIFFGRNGRPSVRTYFLLSRSSLFFYEIKVATIIMAVDNMIVVVVIFVIIVFIIYFVFRSIKADVSELNVGSIVLGDQE